MLWVVNARGLRDGVIIERAAQIDACDTNHEPPFEGMYCSCEAKQA